MSFINGLLIVFLFAGGGIFFAHNLRCRDGSAALLSAALMALGLAEIFELFLSYSFSVYALKSWYFLARILFWGLLGSGIALKAPFNASIRQKIMGAALLGTIAALGLLLLTQITAAAGWYAPERSVFTQYVDLMARNRPMRWLTNLFTAYGVGCSLCFSGYTLFKRKTLRHANLALGLGSILLVGQEFIYHQAGELLGDSAHLLGGTIMFLTIWYLVQGIAPAPAQPLKLAQTLGWAAVIAIIAIGARFRMNAYGDICEAVLTCDSNAFISLSGENVSSLEFFTLNRPAFILSTYKLIGVNPEMRAIWPECLTDPTNLPHLVYPDLNCLSGWHMALAIFSWSVLALVLASKMCSPWLKAVIAALVLGFAYVPQLANWDSVVQSESLSFSLWALVFALSIEFAARIVRDQTNTSATTWLIFLLWSITLISWGFSRDTNVYMILFIGVCSALALLLPKVRKNFSIPVLLVVALFGLALFGVQNSLLYRSDRWVNPFLNNLNRNILPYPEREAWFVERGLSAPDVLYKQANLLGMEMYQEEIADLVAWAMEEGAGIYTRYILTHPVWAFSYFWKISRITFIENLQPYYKATQDSVSPYLYLIGDVLHPKTRAVIWMETAILLGWASLVIAGRSNKTQRSILLVCCLFFIGELGVLFISIHGDALGVIRHALVAVMPLRLMLWLLAISLLDGSLQSFEPGRIAPKKGISGKHPIRFGSYKGDKNVNILGATFRQPGGSDQ